MHETCSCIEKVINNYVLIKRSYGSNSNFGLKPWSSDDLTNSSFNAGIIENQRLIGL